MLKTSWSDNGGCNNVPVLSMSELLLSERVFHCESLVTLQNKSGGYGPIVIFVADSVSCGHEFLYS